MMVWVLLGIVIFSLIMAIKSYKGEKQTTNTFSVPRPRRIYPLNCIENEVLSIDEEGFVGFCNKSPNGEYSIAFGHKSLNSEKGMFLLLHNNRIIFKGSNLIRPEAGEVANNGFFILEDWETPGILGSSFYAFSNKGNLLIRQKLEENIFNSAISADGKYAVCQDASSLICLFDLGNSKLMASFYPIVLRVQNFKFEPENKILRIIYDNNIDFRYDFEGNFLDEKKFQKEKVKILSGYQLIDIVTEEIQSKKDVDYNEIVRLLDAALSKNISQYTQAKAWRLLGDAFLELNNKEKALQSYKNAINLYPKIGVKRIITKLEKES